MPVTIRDKEIHVWQADIARCAALAAGLRTLLSPDERDRASRFRFRRHQEQSILSRGLLRVLIGRYLNVEPRRVQLALGECGKPSLRERLDGDVLCFNVSHSDGVLVFAFARNADIGVDVERVRPDVARGSLAEQYFAPRETTALRSLPPERQPDAFFACWTRKEAYLKARGVGLSKPLSEFDVSRLLGWSLIDFVPRPGFMGAVAVEGHGWHFARLDWNTHA